MRSRPTLESVARQAAVSRQTVSNVLNAPHLVHPTTIERVRRVIDEVGYRPHGAARQLRTRRSHTVGLRLQPSDGINGDILDRFLHALTQTAQDHGYRVLLFTAADDDLEIARYSELLDTVEIDAFVLTSTHHDDPRTRWLALRGVPFVTFGRPWDPAGEKDGGHAWVDVDGASGTRAATDHLRALGHRRIAFLGWPDGSDTGDDRRAGWRAGMTAAGIPAAEIASLDVGVPDDIEMAVAAARRLLRESAPTAFVCVSDTLAVGVLAATRSIPPLRENSAGESEQPRGAVAVVGFDDTPVARTIGLTSVSQPVTEAAKRAFLLLLDQLGRIGSPGTGRHVLLDPTLVVRRTSPRPDQQTQPQNPT
ncbi:LacI family DNA-binding transcriptional regulator [Georgenia sp. M64]|uniref:LacI family DNA-binding transcriptional regulator n=1 Tax=Georgenia sp. M64 TaxID=3120520 RepID=UPI0030E2B20F